MRTLVSIALLGLVGFSPDVTEAATLNTLFKTNGNNPCVNVTQVSTSTKSCTLIEDQAGNLVDVNLLSREEFGNLGISGSVIISDNPSGGSGGSSGGGSVSLNSLDTLTFSGPQTNYLFLLPVDLGGSVSAPETALSAAGGGGSSQATFNATVIANGVASVIYSETRSGITGVRDNLLISGGVGSTGITDLMFNVVGGKLDLTFSLFGTVGCNGRFEAGGACTATFDFFNSLRVLGGTVLDVNGDVVSGVGVTSDSGFDYLKGVDPHIAAVPVPVSVLLMLTGLGAIAGLRRRKKRPA